MAATSITVTGCTDEKRIPKTFGVLVYRGFQALDVFGPLDILNTLALTEKLNLHVIAMTLDPVFTRPHEMDASGSNFSESILPTHTFSTAPPLDVLLVPGGRGPDASELEPIREFVKRTYPSLQYLITVCTGSALVASTGILDGRKATGNKKVWRWVTSQGPKVNWVAKARWTVDGNIWTSSGVAAGMDVMCAFVESIWGEEIANDVIMGLEYDRHRDKDWDPFAEYWGAKWPLEDDGGSECEDGRT